ncbi:thioredoxin family protein [Bdellovibrio reynosensis]|uniref:Thioredoxin family protein n=1 Tax=Bdellovibrio reynosensis TaxID=2835041 RepID=A0ABY4CAM9_9BACT|nr:thioredoxin family protein [Bdellovibrio reynosensis]UOF00947.1 thioredoxin family protein [Bdellovibrio reynosensis]
MSHPIFADLEMEQLRPDTFDSKLEQHANELVGVFFWGHDCPNCEVAKKMIHQDSSDVKSLGLKWFHVNTYEDFDLATRFGLHGIPTFIFFYQGKRLGKISPFPGMTPFMTALRELRAKYPG